MRLHLSLVATAVAAAFAAAVADEAAVERGRYLIHAGGCITCHTKDEDDAVPLAGGRALETPFGTFYSPNITPHEETGIGAWSDDEFVVAFWSGSGPDGEHYFPAFPYTSYTGIAREDLLAMKAYLFSLEPVDAPPIEHDLSLLVSSRAAAGIWKSRYFEPARFEPDPARSEEWNRGAYLVRHLGHCGECHTPRARFGVLLDDQALSGNPEGPGDEKVPSIRNTEDGIGDWSVSDIEYFLDIGMLPDGDFTGGSMAPVIDDNTSHLTDADRRAIATYLKSLNLGQSGRTIREDNQGHPPLFRSPQLGKPSIRDTHRFSGGKPHKGRGSVGVNSAAIGRPVLEDSARDDPAQPPGLPGANSLLPLHVTVRETCVPVWLRQAVRPQL